MTQRSSNSYLRPFLSFNQTNLMTNVHCWGTGVGKGGGNRFGSGSGREGSKA